MAHYFKSYRKNYSKYYKIRARAIDFDGEPSYPHRRHRGRNEKRELDNNKSLILDKIEDEELEKELDNDIKRHLKL